MARRRKNSTRTLTTGGRRGRKSRLASASYTDLQNELNRRESMLQGLMAQRHRVTEELRMIDQRIAAEGGAVPVGGAAFGGRRRRGRPPGSGAGRGMATPKHGRRTRARNGASLVESLRKVLAGTQMSVADVCTAVKRAGYQTTSPNFRTIVNAALLANPTVFKKVERGVYTTK